MEDYERTFEEFWKPLVTDATGELDLDAIKRELHDFRFVLTEVPKVYCHVTGGRISKPNTYAFEVTSQADEHYERIYSEDAEEGSS